MTRPKLVFGIPWESPFMFAQCVDSLLTLQRPEGWDVAFVRGRGHSSARRHIDLCEKALAADATYILVLGADQVYQPDLLCRLVQRLEEGFEVVSALVPTRGFLPFQEMAPFQPMAWRLKSMDELGPDFQYNKRPFRNLAEDADLVHTITRADGGMQRVDFIGSGCLLFHRDHLLSLERPWFYETIEKESQTRIANMDCRFVNRLAWEAQASVWVDTTIPIQHLHIFSIDDSFSDRFQDWALGQGAPDPAICAWRNPIQAGKDFVQTNGVPVRFGDETPASTLAEDTHADAP